MIWNHKIHCLWFSRLYQHSKLAIVNDCLWRWSYVLLQNLSLPVSMGRKSHQVYSFIQFFLLCRYWINSWKWTVQYITLILVIIGWPCRMYRLWCITLHISLQFVAWNFYSSHLSIFFVLSLKLVNRKLCCFRCLLCDEADGVPKSSIWHLVLVSRLQ